MNVLIITQVYFPDTASVSQHLTDLAERLVFKGHSVEVISSRFSYDTENIYSKKTQNNGVFINRVLHLNFNKKYFFFRSLNFLTFNLSLLINLIIKRRAADIIIGTTVPPFSALIGVAFAKIKKIPFYFWVMDLQPELAISSGLLKERSILARFFRFLGDLIIKNSNKLISLDRFMTDHLVKRGANINRIKEIPVWPVNKGFYDGDRSSNPFRIKNNYQDKIVIMFSGNHAHVHPLKTLLEAAKSLKDDERFLFSFIGGGVRKKEVTEFKLKYKLSNIVQHEYQPRDFFHVSIAASDLQVVILGEGQAGFTHPNKIYGAMYLGKPIIYIGPKSSHISEILSNLSENISVSHGEVDSLVCNLLTFVELSKNEISNIGKKNLEYAKKSFNPDSLLNKMVNFIEKSKR